MQNLNENQILSFAIINKDKNDSKKIYLKEYCHFDKLIWQVPTWSTAIFTAAIASGLGFISMDNSNKEIIIGFLNLELKNILSVYFLIFSCILMMFSFVLYRFRVHQQPLGRYEKVPFYKSAQLYLQSITYIESLILFYLALIIFRVQDWVGSNCIFYILLLFLLWWWIAEINLRKNTPLKT